MRPVHVAWVLAMVCGVAAWQVTSIPESLMQMTVGARLVPAAVVTALTALVLLFGLSAWKGRQVDESQAPDQSPLPGSGARMFSSAGRWAGLHGIGHFLGFYCAGHAVRHGCGAGIRRPLEPEISADLRQHGGDFLAGFCALVGRGTRPWPALADLSLSGAPHVLC
jgi:hypothetical protein